MSPQRFERLLGAVSSLYVPMMMSLCVNEPVSLFVFFTAFMACYFRSIRLPAYIELTWLLASAAENP